GVVSDVGEVVRVGAGTKLNHLRIACSYPAETIAPGASIACGGPCLTVVACGESGNRRWFEVDVAAETLACTTARHWRRGTRLNLERPLRLGDELGGHFVTGHVDGVAEIVAITDFDGMRHFDIKARHDLARFIAEKGSVALDGTSLTVNRVEADIFSVLLIPQTLKVTTWGERRGGDEINLEVDMMARYAARLAGALSQKP
ncbi:MAG: riboflavin synthase, partial [Methylocella sp.]